MLTNIKVAPAVDQPTREESPPHTSPAEASIPVQSSIRHHIRAGIRESFKNGPTSCRREHTQANINSRSILTQTQSGDSP